MKSGLKVKKSKLKKEFIHIDDDPIFLKISEIMFAKLNQADNFKAFNSAEKAKAYLKEKDLTNLKITFLLDIEMPLTNGWEFLEELMQNDNYDNFEVLILSSSVDPKEELKAKTLLGKNRFISKPLDYNQLKEIISAD